MPPAVPSVTQVFSQFDRTIGVQLVYSNDASVDYYEWHLSALGPISDADVVAGSFRHELVIKHDQTKAGQSTFPELLTKKGFTRIQRGDTYNIRILAVDTTGAKSAASPNLPVQIVDFTAPSLPTGVGMSSTVGGTLGITFNGGQDLGAGGGETDSQLLLLPYYEIHLHTANILDADVVAATYRHPLTVKHQGTGVPHAVRLGVASDGVTPLIVGTAYFLRLVSIDRSGNRSAGTAVQTMVVSPIAFPSSGISGLISAVAATSATIQLTAFPPSGVNGWALSHRLRSPSAPNPWTQSPTNPNLVAGQTITISGLVEGALYEVAIHAMNGATRGDFGTVFNISPHAEANTWDGTQITERIMALVDENLTTTLSLTRPTQYGTIKDYPNLRDQSSVLPLCLVELTDAEYAWRQFPRTYDVIYRFRVTYVRKYATTEAVVRSRVDMAGQLAGLFSAFRQLGLNGGRTVQGQVVQALPGPIEIRPVEDDFDAHGNIYAVTLGLTVQAVARA